MKDDVLNAALQYADQFLLVIIDHSIVDGKCTCPKLTCLQDGCNDQTHCHHPGKHPRLLDFLNQATADKSKIKSLINDYSHSNVAIATGKRSRRVVLDVDPRNGGLEPLAKWTDEHPEYFETLRARTGGDGYHYHYLYPAGTSDIITGPIAPGIELKADRAKVTMPPSSHISGKHYTWDNDLDPIELPQFFLQQRINKKLRKSYSEKKVRQTISEKVVDLCAGISLFHDSDKAYATVGIDGHNETYPIKSRPFKRLLSSRFHKATGKVLNSQSLNDSLNVLEGKALFENPEIKIHVRVAEVEDKIYVDLCNDKWQVVQIDAAGWRVVDTTNIKFIRYKSMLSLPIPVTGGNIKYLQSLLGMGDEDFLLFLAFLIQCIQESGPFAIALIHAEHGVGKTTILSATKKLIDPSKTDKRGQPRTSDDVMIAATRCHLLSLDNISHITDWLSDTMCRISTGAAHGKRTLFEDDDETILEAIKPQMLTSIKEVATFSDLLDRCIIIYLPNLDDERRKDEKALWKEFEIIRPALLGALYDYISSALANKNTSIKSLPRMADFARFVCAAMPDQAANFLKLYKENRASANKLSLDASILTPFIDEFMTEKKEWEGTATLLLDALEEIAREKSKPHDWLKPRDWPKQANVFSNELRALAGNFRANGLAIEFDKSSHETGRQRIVRLLKRKTSSQPSPSSHVDDKTRDDQPARDDVGPSQTDRSSPNFSTIGDDRDDRDDPLHLNKCLRHGATLVPSEYGPVCPVCFEEIDAELTQ